MPSILTRTTLLLTLGAMLALSVPYASAAVPEAYRALWNDSAVKERIDQGIERNRKQDAQLQLRTADGKPVTDAAVELKQQTHEFLFGCNAFVLGQLDTPEKNRVYEESFAKLFNFATVPFYWEGTEPTQGELRYAEGGRDMWRRPPPDRYLAFGAKYAITLKGHPLLWHAYNPSWLPKDPEVLKKLYQKRFGEISTRYAKDIKIWDVVNESLCCPKNYQLFTPDRAYVGWAFEQVKPLFPTDTTLMINETMHGSHRGVGEGSPYFKQVTKLLADGAAVRGIGFQFHFFDYKAMNKGMTDPMFTPKHMLDVYESFVSFNLPLYVTEITVPMPPEDSQATQAELVADYYRLWFSAPKMAGITWWNLGDGTAVKGENKAFGGLLDDKFQPKESYRALDKLINQDWKTNLQSKTDAQGTLKFRGFCGKYTVKVTSGGRTQELELKVSKDGPISHTLTLKP